MTLYLELDIWYDMIQPVCVDVTGDEKGYFYYFHYKLKMSSNLYPSEWHHIDTLE